jgi:hypothetical protein
MEFLDVVSVFYSGSPGRGDSGVCLVGTPFFRERRSGAAGWRRSGWQSRQSRAERSGAKWRGERIGASEVKRSREARSGRRGRRSRRIGGDRDAEMRRGLGVGGVLDAEGWSGQRVRGAERTARPAEASETGGVSTDQRGQARRASTAGRWTKRGQHGPALGQRGPASARQGVARLQRGG